MAKNVTNILQLPPTYFVSNIDVADPICNSSKERRVLLIKISFERLYSITYTETIYHICLYLIYDGENESCKTSEHYHPFICDRNSSQFIVKV